jgi:hypothetical protein
MQLQNKFNQSTGIGIIFMMILILLNSTSIVAQDTYRK